MNLTLEQVEQMAPDPAAAAAGRKLAALKNWAELGRSAGAVWGKCQGSAVYQVKIDLANLGYHCSCPSRKFPCKHVLALLVLAVQSSGAVAQADNPEWVDEWLLKRRAREEKQAAARTEPTPAPGSADDPARRRRTDQRARLVRDGLDRLDLWMRDLIRTGLAETVVKPNALWDEQAKRLVDAQAPGLAARVGRLASLSRSAPDWADRLLGELGRITLLIHAYHRLDQLDPALASDVRQLIGWTISQEELEQTGQRLDDTWVVAGQWVDDHDRIVARRSWVVGRQTKRTALILQFAPAGQPFTESMIAGTEQPGTVVFYPGASGERARFLARQGTPAAVEARPPGFASIDAFLAMVAESLARQPWLSAFGGVLLDVTLVRHRETWWARDSHGQALPILGHDHWKAMAITGGHPFDLGCEWDGHGLRPLGLFVAGQYGGL
jgi:hypothetical protein